MEGLQPGAVCKPVSQSIKIPLRKAILLVGTTVAKAVSNISGEIWRRFAWLSTQPGEAPRKEIGQGAIDCTQLISAEFYKSLVP